MTHSLTVVAQKPADLSRRLLLVGAAGLAACGLRKSRGFRGYALVANAGGRTVAAVDLEAFVLARQIGMEAAPGAIVPHPRRPAAYVLIPETGTVCEIDALKLDVVRKRRLGAPALTMLLSPDKQSLWVLRQRALVRLETNHLRIAQVIPLPGAASSFDLGADARAAVTFPADGRLALVRLDTGTVEHLVDTGAGPSLVRFRGDGKQVLAGTADHSLTIFDTASGQVVVRLPMPVEPAHACFDTAGGQMFVTGPGMDVVVIVYPFQTEVGETILAGRAPAGMAVSGSFGYLFVANPQSDSITVLDIDTRKLVAAVAVGQEPRQILITPDNQYALVLNWRSGNMAVIRNAAFTARRYRTNPAPLFTMVPVGLQPAAAAVVAVP